MFEAVPVKESGLSFVHAFDSEDPRAFLYHTGYSCGGICVGDLDGDTLPDLFFSGGPAGNAVYLNRGGFKFEDTTTPVARGEAGVWETGATLVDLDGDGDRDVVVSAYDSPLRVLVNDGEAGFSEVPGSFGLGLRDAVFAVSFADVDRDGDLDAFALCNMYYRQGGRPAEPPVETRDGRPVVKPEFEKFYTLREEPDGGGLVMDNYGRADRFFLNTGSATAPRFEDFSDSSGLAKQGHGLSCVWWDYDGDGWIDLHVSNDFLEPDRLFRNLGVIDGGPRFEDVALEAYPTVSWSSMGSAVADLDGDGRPDLLTLDMASTSHFKSKLNMGAMEGTRRWILENGWPRQSMRNHLFLNTGTGRFLETAWASGIAVSDWSWAPCLADFDLDGHVDAFVTNGSSRNYTDSDVAEGFGNPDIALIGKTSWDLYADGDPYAEKNLAFRNRGDGLATFEDASEAWGLNATTISYSAAIGDFDGDGDPDLVVSDLGKAVRLFRNTSSDAKHLTVRLKGQAIGSRVVATSERGVRQTRWITPLAGFQSQHEDVARFGFGGSDRPVSVSVLWPTGEVLQAEVPVGANTVELDFAKAAKPEATVAVPALYQRISEQLPLTEFSHSETPHDDYARQPLLPGKLSQLGPCHALSDVDGDGDSDLYVGGGARQAGSLFLNQGDRFVRMRVSAFRSLNAGSEDTAALWFDADGDGDEDLYVASGSTEFTEGSSFLADRLYLTEGASKPGGLPKFQHVPDALPAGIHDVTSCAAAADFDGDGDLDLFTGTRCLTGRYPLPSPGRILRNESDSERGVRFVDVTAEVVPSFAELGLVTGAAWSDLDKDGNPDLLVACEWGPVKVFRGNGKTLTETTLVGNSRSGWWSSLDAIDVDGDGDLDFVLGNVGWNTKYGRADKTHPAVIYYGDMDGSGVERIIEVKQLGDQWLPVRGRSCSSGAIPSLNEKFKSFRQFAAAELSEIYSTDSLSGAKRFEADCFESGVLLNDSSGNPGEISLLWLPFPHQAQISPINQAAAIDIAGGRALVLAQNHDSREAETGLWRGGLGCVLRLRATPKRGFEILPPSKTGLVLNGDVKSLAVVDGGVSVIGFRNGDAPLVYRRTTESKP